MSIDVSWIMYILWKNKKSSQEKWVKVITDWNKKLWDKYKEVC